jgi:hypothetical protein
VVAAKCPPSEVLCSDRVSCSQAGVCLADLQQKAAGGPDALLQEPEVDSAPNITLLGSPVGHPPVPISTDPCWRGGQRVVLRSSSSMEPTCLVCEHMKALDKSPFEHVSRAPHSRLVTC